MAALVGLEPFFVVALRPLGGDEDSVELQTLSLR